jgi:hypothetical protein
MIFEGREECHRRDMGVRYFYIDESWDDDKFVLTAISFRHVDWHDCLKRAQQHRIRLRDDFGMFRSKEIHARDLVGGRGNIAKKIIGKRDRSVIFRGIMELIATMPNIMLFNVCLPQHGKKETESKAWDRMINRIERTTLEYENIEIVARKNLLAELPFAFPAESQARIEERLLRDRPRAMIFADQGSEIEITRICRKMAVFNPVPSKFGIWSEGALSRNIRVQRIVEDPTFRNSQRSLLIQLADCAAFALLKREVNPTPNIEKYGIYKLFDQYLAGVCYKPACPSDPCGIVRK